MKLSLTLVLGISTMASARIRRAKEEKDVVEFTAPHEVHQFEQVKYYDEPEWACNMDSVAGHVGCIKCWNPRDEGEDALIVEVKAMYKREELNIKDETVNKPRKHCIFPGRGYFWTCFNSNLVIEPDSDWLGELKDKPIYNSTGMEALPDQDGICYPGHMAADLPDNGATFV